MLQSNYLIVNNVNGVPKSKVLSKFWIREYSRKKHQMGLCVIKFILTVLFSAGWTDFCVLMVEALKAWC